MSLLTNSVGVSVFCSLLVVRMSLVVFGVVFVSSMNGEKSGCNVWFGSVSGSDGC